jgi:tetratricopeptide (TPR) repeat protein
MRGTKAILATAILLAAAAAVTAEVALDEVVQAGRFALYRDHADAHKYYYVPDAPRLATKRDGTPEFTFIKYAKTDGETKGGVLHFLVTWGFSEGELASAESALRLKDPQARIAGPVPFKEGTFKVVSATAGEGGIFNRKIVGEGKAPIMPGQKAAVSIALTEEGASLLWESFKNPTSDISVMFALKFAGVTPAFQAKLKVNWDKVYTQHDIKLHAEGTIKVVKIQADVRAILENLRQQGAIQLDVVGENESMQKMLDAVYGHLITLMCDKVPMGPGEAMSPATKRPAPAPAPNGEWPGLHPAWSAVAVGQVVRTAGERLRGGPFWDQDQVQAQSQRAASGCDEPSRRRAEALAREAAGLLRQREYLESNAAYQKAFEACPEPRYLYEMGMTAAFSLLDWNVAVVSFRGFLEKTADLSGYTDQRATAQTYLADYEQAHRRMLQGEEAFGQGRYQEALEAYRWLYDRIPLTTWMFNMGVCYKAIGDETGNKEEYEKALRCFEAVLNISAADPDRFQYDIDGARACIEALRPLIEPAGAAAAQPRTEQVQVSTEEARRQRRQEAQQAQTGQAQTATGGQQAAATGAQSGGTKPPTAQTQGANIAGGQAQQQALSLHGTKPPDTTGGTKPPTGQTGTAGQTATAPAAKPGATAPEVKPIVSVQIGYSFKRVKMSGNYEVDMRKRLREDRDIVMSGNIGGVYQKYGEDRRFFSVVSLDDPTFQERSVEVLLDGQDASDFKSYINSVSVLFRKQRFSGPPMTGEVKFVDQQFAQSGNHQSFKYGRLNEASTEWLDYEYKPKWSLYGGIEWEGEWTKTSDSVLTLTPPVRRRTLQISVDEDNVLKNNVKALAVQVKHTIFGKDILKEVVINYDKGDPLEAEYTYMHEDGNLGYSYKIVWLLLDGREVHTDWMAKESPFILAVFAKK